MAPSLKNELVKMIRTLAYRKGEFVLASGKTSPYYVDLKSVTLHPKGLNIICELAWSWFRPDEFGGVGGPTMGADPIATALSLAALSKGIVLPAFILRKEPKKYGTSKWIEGVTNLNKSKELLVIEDTITTGGSAVKAIQKLRDEGFEVNKLFAIVDRQEGASETLGKIDVEILALTTLSEIRD